MAYLLEDVQRTEIIQFAQVPVTLGTATEWRSIYYLPINNVHAGELIQVYSEGQVRNDLNYNVELAQTIEFRTAVVNGQEPLGSLGGFTSPINGWDFDTKVHYGRFSKFESWIAPQDYAIIYLVMRLRFRSTGANTGDYITVNNGQGYLFFNRFTQEA